MTDETGARAPYTAPVLGDFQGDPLASEHSYLTEESFADEVLKLEPSWKIDRSGLVSVLRRFDEAGLLRPRLRLRLPEEYPWYVWHGTPNPVRDGLSEEQKERFEYIKYNISRARRHFDDPVALHPLQGDEVLTPLMEDGDAATDVEWDRWVVQVGAHDVRPGVALPIRQPRVRSYYAPWQRLRAWTLLTRYTLRFLADPRAGRPSDVMNAVPLELANKHLYRESGHGHGDELVVRLSGDGWLTSLYRARALVEWSELRTWKPAYQAWPAGVNHTSDQRWIIERPRLEERCARLARPWTNDAGLGRTIPEAFVAKVKELLKLWMWAKRHASQKFVDVVFEDVYATVDWAIFAFQTNFGILSKEVGSLPDYEYVSLTSILEPTRHRSRKVVESHLSYLVPEFNRQVRRPKLDERDGKAFLDFLDANELWAWTMELAEYLEADKISGDVNLDRRFLHLRSLALLNEQLLAILANQFGTPEERGRMDGGTLLPVLMTFLVGKPGWRGRLWQAIRNNYVLTDTAPRAERTPAEWPAMSPPARLRARFDAIQALEIHKSIAGGTKHILAFATMRNFGAHRFTRDVDTVHRYAGFIASAVLFSALLYWKAATSQTGS